MASYFARGAAALAVLLIALACGAIPSTQAADTAEAAHAGHAALSQCPGGAETCDWPAAAGSEAPISVGADGTHAHVGDSPRSGSSQSYTSSVEPHEGPSEAGHGGNTVEGLAGGSAADSPVLTDPPPAPGLVNAAALAQAAAGQEELDRVTAGGVTEPGSDALADVAAAGAGAQDAAAAAAVVAAAPGAAAATPVPAHADVAAAAPAEPVGGPPTPEPAPPTLHSQQQEQAQQQAQAQQQQQHAEQVLAPVAVALDELRALLQGARRAVEVLEAAVAAQEQRVRELAAAAAAAAAVAIAAPPADAAAGAAAPDISVTLLRGLGLDANDTLAARSALRDAVQLLLTGRAPRGRAPSPDAGPAAQLPGGAATLLTPLPPPSELAAAATAASGTGRPGDWFSQHFHVAAALRTAAPVTCSYVYELPLPDLAGHGGGPTVYTVVGDAGGNLYLVSRGGELLWQQSTGTPSPVTACSAYLVRKGESTVVTGHADGQTRSFHVLQQAPPPHAQHGGAEGGGAAAAARGKGGGGGGGQGGASNLAAAVDWPVASVVLRHVVASMPRGALPWGAVEPGAAALMGVEGVPWAGADVAEPVPERLLVEGAAGAGEEGQAPPGLAAPIMHILPYRLGHKPGGRRHVAVVDRAGNVRLDRENGTARFWGRSNRTQLAARFVGNYLVLLSEQHTTVMSTLQLRSPRAFACAHLNGSRLLAAAFDVHRQFRAYGLNDRGELLSLVTPHEGRITACKAHRATPLPYLDAAALAAPPAPLLSALPGYLMLTHGSLRVLYNTTGFMRAGIPTLAAVDDGAVGEYVSSAAVHASDHELLPDTQPPARGSASAARALPLLRPVAGAGARTGGVVVLGLSAQPPGAPGGAAGGAAAGGAGAEKGAVEDVGAAAGGAEQRAAGGGGAAGVGAGTGAGVGAAPSAGGAAGDDTLAGGMVVLLTSRLPCNTPPAVDNTKVWMQPIFVGAMVLVGLYQFWRMSSSRTQRRGTPAAYGVPRRRRGGGLAGMYGGGGDGDDYGMPRVPLQPRSALRQTRSERAAGGRRTVSYADDYD